MEAGSRLRRFWIGMIAGWVVGACLCHPADAANIRTQNFLVQAPTPGLAKAVAEAAERYRHDLAVHWFGNALRPWPAPCPIRVIAGPNLAAQGVTTYNPAPVRDFQMEVVGTPERILDSVLPHEVTHTIMATHFGRPLPRWADEGICTTVEHASERNKHELKLREFLNSRRGIAMNRLFLMTEYPADVLPMYAQGYSVCRFLIDQKGPRTFIRFLHDYMNQPSWTVNIKKHYNYDSLRELQEFWLAWVDQGSGEVAKFSKTKPAAQIALATELTGSPKANSTIPIPTRIPPQPESLALNGPTSSGPVAQASAIDPRPGTALASAVSHGWYQRRRMEVQQRSPLQPQGQSQQPGPLQQPGQLPSLSGGDGGMVPMVPPSVRNSGQYSAAQPQSEQHLSRAETPRGGLGDFPRPVGGMLR